MAEKKFSLTKQESDRLNSLLSVAQIQQEVFDAVTERYRNFIFLIFKRLSLKPELFQYTKVNLGDGILTVDEPKEEKQKEGGKDEIPVKDGSVQPNAQAPEQEGSEKV